MPLNAQSWGTERGGAIAMDRSSSVVRPFVNEDVWMPPLRKLSGAYTERSLMEAARSFRFFQVWCTRQGLTALPADAETIASFIDDYADVYRPRTLAHHLLGVRRVHLAMALPNPLAGEAVRVARIRHRRRRPPARRIDATLDVRDRLLAACPPGLLGLRDRAMIHLAFDTLCRRSELVLFRVEDLRPLGDGTGSIAVRRLRDGPEVVHNVAFLSASGLTAVQAWLARAKLRSGPILRGVGRGRPSPCRLATRTVAYRLSALSKCAEIPERLTSHSLRVGAAQTLAASGRTLLQVMRAGRWCKLEVPAAYLQQARVNVWSDSDGDTFALGATSQRWRYLAAPLTPMPRGWTETFAVGAEVGGVGEGRSRTCAQAQRRDPLDAIDEDLRSPLAGEAGWRAALERLRGAYSDCTLREYGKCLRLFQQWSDARGETSFPATPSAVAAYVAHCAQRLSPASIEQHLFAIRRVHLMLGLTDPTRADVVLVERHRSQCGRPHHPRQALGIDGRTRDRLLAACADDLVGLRNRALIHLGFDTLCRCSELVQLRIEDLEYEEHGTARILVRRSKSDRFGRGEWAFLSKPGLEAVSAWLAAAKLTSGPVLRGFSVGPRGIGAGGLTPSIVRKLVRGVAREAGYTAEQVSAFSSHSFRVGAAQELAAAGCTLLEIMRAGRWRSTDAVATYLRTLVFNPWSGQKA